MEHLQKVNGKLVCDPLMTITSGRGDGFEERISLESTVPMEVMGPEVVVGGVRFYLEGLGCASGWRPTVDWYNMTHA